MARRVTIPKKAKVIEQELALALFEQFINDSYSGARTKPNGTKISLGTVENYTYVFKNLQGYVQDKKGTFKIYNVDHLNQREKEAAKKFYVKFYDNFTSYLYDDKNAFDNYVGFNIKYLRSFYNYLEAELHMSVGSFHKSFYTPVEEIPIIALSPEQLRYFISNEGFNQVVQENELETIKDIFVFGCTVALRFSDLISLKESNLMIKGDDHYISVKSQKTRTYTSIKLPHYCVEILQKYEGNHKTLLPPISNAWFNKQLKQLARLIPNDFEMVKTRERRGKEVIIYKNFETKTHFKLSDHITTHTMRRTGITTMLNLGMPEHLVRKISGHSPNSKEFFRYVKLSQGFIDSETDRVFSAIAQ